MTDPEYRMIEAVFHPERTTQLARTYIDGVVINTAMTGDLGYETAVLDAEAAHPVARYATEDQARAGHQWWRKHIVGAQTVIELGYPGAIEDEEVRLVRPYPRALEP
jgi:hypothetical protein